MGIIVQSSVDPFTRPSTYTVGYFQEFMYSWQRVPSRIILPRNRFYNLFCVWEEADIIPMLWFGHPGSKRHGEDLRSCSTVGIVRLYPGEYPLPTVSRYSCNKSFFWVQSSICEDRDVRFFFWFISWGCRGRGAACIFNVVRIRIHL